MAAGQRKDSSERRVAFLGGGRMGEALASGLVRSKARAKSELIVTCRREERAAELAKRLGVQTSLSNPDAVAWAHTVVLTVKPQDMEGLLAQVAGAITPEHLVVSFAAGIRTSYIEKYLVPGVPVVRAMSNVPVLVDEAMSVVSAGLGRGRQAPRRRRGAALGGREGDPPAREAPGRHHGDQRIRARLLLPAGRGDDRGLHPARPGARRGHRADHPDDARVCQDAAGHRQASRRASRDGDLARAGPRSRRFVSWKRPACGRRS